MRECPICGNKERMLPVEPGKYSCPLCGSIIKKGEDQ